MVTDTGAKGRCSGTWIRMKKRVEEIYTLKEE